MNTGRGFLAPGTARSLRHLDSTVHPQIFTGLQLPQNAFLLHRVQHSEARFLTAAIASTVFATNVHHADLCMLLAVHSHHAALNSETWNLITAHGAQRL